MLTVKIGIWHDRVSVFFRDRPTCGYRVELDREADEFRLLSGDLHAVLHAADAEETSSFPYRIDDFEADRDGFARCSLMQLTMTEVANGFYAEMPQNHELPWPFARDCTGYSLANELMSECEVRRTSAKNRGERIPTPPGHITASLTPRMRLTLFG